MGEKYWTVEFKAFAFDTEEQARKFQEALEDAFMELPESEGICSTSIILEKDEDDE
jgi:hypothetical protein